MADLVYFDPARVALAEEVRNHPELIELLHDLEKQGIPADDFETRLAAIASYCQVMMDGYYYQEELTKLCDTLIQKLRQKRSIIILPNR